MKTRKALGALLGALALTGCGHHEAPTPSAPTAPSPVVANPTAPAKPNPTAPPTRAVVYTVDEAHGTDADDYLVPRQITLADPRDPAREAVRALLDAPHSPLPAGTKLNGIKTADGLATVDFSRPPVDETHGEERQAQALEALQRTLGQFPDISRLQITVNGKAPASLGESGGGPMDVLRPGERPLEAGGA